MFPIIVSRQRTFSTALRTSTKRRATFLHRIINVARWNNFLFLLLSRYRSSLLSRSILNYGVRVSRKTTVCQQRWAGGGVQEGERVPELSRRGSCNFDGKKDRERKRKKNCNKLSTFYQTASQERPYVQDVKKSTDVHRTINNNTNNDTKETTKNFISYIRWMNVCFIIFSLLRRYENRMVKWIHNHRVYFIDEKRSSKKLLVDWAHTFVRY